MDPLRRGGRLRVATGASITWSVAEGRRGRRWRELVQLPGSPVGLRHSLLLETNPDGRFAHLELSTRSGLLTLHPEADGTLHGNAIVDHGESDLRDATGVEHVRGLVWPSDGVAIVEGSLICELAVIHALGKVLVPFASRSHPAIWIPPTLWLDVRPIRVERIDDRVWRIGESEALKVDDLGLPVDDRGTTWPLDESD